MRGRAVLTLGDLPDLAAEDLPAAVLWLDRNGSIGGANRRGRALLEDLDADECFRIEEQLCAAEPSFEEQPTITIAAGGRAALTFSASISQRHDAAGAPDGVLCILHDITRQQQRESHLQASQDFLLAMIRATPECVKLVGLDGALLQMNDAGLAMIEADDFPQVSHRSTLELIAPEHREAWRQNHEAVCGGNERAWEFDIVGLKGSRRHMQTHAVPLALPDGAIAQLAITRDVTERKEQQSALLARERWYGQLLEALPVAVYTTDADGFLTFYNSAAAEFWGREPELGAERWCGAWKLYDQSGEPLAHDDCPMATAIRNDSPSRDEEAVAERQDGTHAAFQSYPTPLHDVSGKLVGAVNMLIDITRHKDDAARQQLLINELNHRVKNTLSTIQSISQQTFKNDGTPSLERFQQRLMALSRAHDVLTSEGWRTADISEIVRQAVAPFVKSAEHRATVSGGPVLLKPPAALALSMAIHELCSNAVKYGAWSAPDGSVDLQWHRADTPEGERLVVAWEEHGGPTVTRPAKRGFGLKMIERGLAHDLKADIKLDFAQDGMRCEISAPLAA